MSFNGMALLKCICLRRTCTALKIVAHSAH